VTSCSRASAGLRAWMPVVRRYPAFRRRVKSSGNVPDASQTDRRYEHGNALGFSICGFSRWRLLRQRGPRSFGGEKLLKAHQQEHVPAPPPSKAYEAPERCSPTRGRFATPKGAPLSAPRRSGRSRYGMGGCDQMAHPCQRLRAAPFASLQIEVRAVVISGSVLPMATLFAM
jgi:hypothetical protein